MDKITDCKRLLKTLADQKVSVEGGGPTLAVDEIMASARDVAKLLREAAKRAKTGRVGFF